jgi:hypothetical protein
MNTNFVAVIKRIIAEQGEDILANSQRMKGYVNDYAARESKVERLVFCRCIEYGAYTELKNAPDARARQAVKAALAQKVNANEGLELVLCKDAFDALEAALFGAPTPQPQTALPSGRVPSSRSAVEFDALIKAYNPSPPTLPGHSGQILNILEASPEGSDMPPVYKPPQALQKPSRNWMNKAGSIIGFLMMWFGVLLLVMGIWIVWFLIPIAVLGLCLSALGVGKNTPDKGLGIGGIVLNGLFLLVLMLGLFKFL